MAEASIKLVAVCHGVKPKTGPYLELILTLERQA